jgi:2-polyprenyl-6-hydroxyphenyl methylase/3-demethylubiquinone-9 3-methyltransferase
MSEADGYFVRVLSEQWTAAVGAPAVLTIGRDGGQLPAELVRLGCRVDIISLHDGSLERLSQRLAGMVGRFDAVCCRDVIEELDDWDEVIARIARLLRGGGLFLYRIGRVSAGRLPIAGAIRRWLGPAGPRQSLLGRRPAVTAGALAASLRRAGLLPREMVPLHSGRNRFAPAGTVYAGARSHMGYSVRTVDRPELAAGGMRWEFTDTAERWMAGARAAHRRI